MYATLPLKGHKYKYIRWQKLGWWLDVEGVIGFRNDTDN